MTGILERPYNIFLRIKTKNTSHIKSRENLINIYRQNLETKLFPRKDSEENNYDIVLAGDPSTADNDYFYDQIVSLVEIRNFGIYSPHNNKCSEKEKMDFMINNAIPNAKGALIHLNPFTDNVKLLFYEICKNERPLFMIYNIDSECFNPLTKQKIKSITNFVGEIKYNSQYEAINLLEENIDKLLEAAKNN